MRHCGLAPHTSRPPLPTPTFHHAILPPPWQPPLTAPGLPCLATNARAQTGAHGPLPPAMWISFIIIFYVTRMSSLLPITFFPLLLISFFLCFYATHMFYAPSAFLFFFFRYSCVFFFLFFFFFSTAFWLYFGLAKAGWVNPAFFFFFLFRIGGKGQGGLGVAPPKFNNVSFALLFLSLRLHDPSTLSFCQCC